MNTEIEEIYNLYQQKMRENNAIDFNDMLLLVVSELQKNKDLLAKVRSKFQYILVDEYQV